MEPRGNESSLGARHKRYFKNKPLFFFPLSCFYTEANEHLRHFVLNAINTTTFTASTPKPFLICSPSGFVGSPPFGSIQIFFVCSQATLELARGMVGEWASMSTFPLAFRLLCCECTGGESLLRYSSLTETIRRWKQRLKRACYCTDKVGSGWRLKLMLFLCTRNCQESIIMPALHCWWPWVLLCQDSVLSWSYSSKASKL